MKTTLLTLALCALTMSAAQADRGRPGHGGPGPGRPGHGGGLPPDLVAFDLDGNGKLNAAELAALKAAIEAKRAEFLAKWDENGDGVLDSAERAAAKEEIQAEREAERIAERTAKFAEIDTDDPPGISPEELAASLPDVSAGRVAALFAKLDADDDGSISLAEFLAKPAKRPHPHRHGR